MNKLRELFVSKGKLPGTIFVTALWVAGGILVLFKPEISVKVALLVLCAALIIKGSLRILKYFRAPVGAGADSSGFSMGLIFVAAGIFILVRHELTESVMPFLIGFLLLANGIMKLQLGIDLLRLRSKRWYIGMIICAVLIITGLIVTSDPFKSFSMRMTVTGIAMLLAAIAQAASYKLLDMAMKEREGANNVQAEGPAVPAAQTEKDNSEATAEGEAPQDPPEPEASEN